MKSPNTQERQEITLTDEHGEYKAYLPADTQEAGERTRAAIITAGGWEEKAALEGSLTFGQTREVLAAVIEQRDVFLHELKEFVSRWGNYPKPPTGGDLKIYLDSARAAIAKAEPKTDCV